MSALKTKNPSRQISTVDSEKRVSSSAQTSTASNSSYMSNTLEKPERSEVGTQKSFAVNNNPTIPTARDIPHMKAKSWLHDLINKSLLAGAA